MRWAASRASGCRGVVACANASLGMVAGTRRIARGAIPLRLQRRFFGAPERRVHEVQPATVQVEPAHGRRAGRPRRARAPPPGSWNCTGSDPNRSPGSASGPSPPRLVHAPPRRRGIPLRPRERPAVEGAHARGARKVRRIGRLEDPARLAPLALRARGAGCGHTAAGSGSHGHRARSPTPPSAPPPRRPAPAPPGRPPDRAAPRGPVPRAGCRARARDCRSRDMPATAAA